MTATPSHDDGLTAFATVAAEYCSFIESLRQGRPPKVFRKLESLFPRLHIAIMAVESEMADQKHPEFDRLRMTHEQWSELAGLLQDIFSEETLALFEEHGGAKSDANEVEKYCATRAEMLWDDLADIYRDLQYGLTLSRLDTPDAKAEASWQWRFQYELHWGEHLFRAMATVHEARYQLFAD